MPKLCIDGQQDAALGARRWLAVDTAQRLADDLFLKVENSPAGPPLAALEAMRNEGLLAAPLSSALGGLGLGTEAGGFLPLLRLLAALGGGDLSLGRLYEGHVNALLLVEAYGTLAQVQRAAEDAHAGLLFGVWNSGEPKPMQLESLADGWALQGSKTFATGAAFVQRPVVTAEFNGWQMTIPRMERPEIASTIRLDRESWQPLGMESSESLTITFNRTPIAPRDLLGAPGAFYRDPLFRGGAVRFAAVQSGALVRLAHASSDWITSRGRQSDPYQIARLGEIELLAQQAALWVERAAAVSEDTFHHPPCDASTRRMVRCANMTRLAILRSAEAMMSHVVAGVGAHGLLRPARFERIVRDLTMYLRQPNADGTLADVGRSALLQGGSDYWTDAASTALG